MSMVQKNQHVQMCIQLLAHDDAAILTSSQDVFETVISATVAYQHIPDMAKSLLVDAMCSNLSVLNATLMSVSAADDAETRQTNRSALMCYVTFLHHILQEGQKFNSAAPADATAAAAELVAGKRGAKAKAAKAAKAAALTEYDWPMLRAKTMRALASATVVDLQSLFSPAPVDDALLTMLGKCAMLLLEDAPAVAGKALREQRADVWRVFSALALTHANTQLEPVAESLRDALAKHEHVAPLLAELCEFATLEFGGGDSRLFTRLCTSLAAVEDSGDAAPTAADTAGARNAATFLQECAERMPKLVASNMAILLPFLAHESYTLRSAIVGVMGSIVAGAFSANDEASVEDGPGGPMARLRSKQHVLDLLCERVHDKNAYTRSKTLQVWASLCADKLIPIGHWNHVAKLAVGRLNDKSSLVRKAAMQLLGTLMQFNPFAPELPSAAFATTLQDYTERLKAMEADAKEAAKKAEENIWGEGDDEDEEDAGDDVDEDSDGKPKGSLPENIDGEIASCRALVASLETAHSFTLLVSQALTQVVLPYLLTSAVATDVVEAVSFAGLALRFRIDGAPAAFRKALLLVYSREMAVRDSLRMQFSDLYFNAPEGGDVEDLPVDQQSMLAYGALSGLLELADGCTAGELAALEDVVALLARSTDEVPSVLYPRFMAICWSVASDPAIVKVRCPDIAFPSARKTRQLALNVLASAATTNPELVMEEADDVDDALCGLDDKWSVLLHAGFGEGARPGDARCACRVVTELARSCAADIGDAGSLFGAQVTVSYGAPGTPGTSSWKKAFHTALSRSELSEGSYYATATAVLDAAFACMPNPEHFMAAVLQEMYAGLEMPAASEEEDGGGDAEVSAMRLSRFLYVLGHASLNQLVRHDSLARAIRKKEESEKTGSKKDEEDSLAGVTGNNVQQLEMEIEDAQRRADADMLLEDGSSAIGAYVPFVAQLLSKCRSSFTYAPLRNSLALCVTKLMLCSERFCRSNLRAVVAWSRDAPESSVRCTLAVGLADLAVRWPNAVEPYTDVLYARLSDSSTRVRKQVMLSLSHLILCDMVKIRGNVADVARCLADDDAEVRDAAKRLFAEWAKRGPNNVAGVALDVATTLLTTNIPLDRYRAIMTYLLSFVEREKHVSSMMERLVLRFATDDSTRVGRGLACCCALLPPHAKALKALVDNLAAFKAAAASDSECAASILEALLKQKKGADKGGELKGELAEKVTAVEDHLKQCLGLVDEEEEAQEEEEMGGDKENEENAGATKGVAVGSNLEPVASPLVQAR